MYVYMVMCVYFCGHVYACVCMYKYVHKYFCIYGHVCAMYLDVRACVYLL